MRALLRGVPLDQDGRSGISGCDYRVLLRSVWVLLQNRVRLCISRRMQVLVRMELLVLSVIGERRKHEPVTMRVYGRCWGRLGVQRCRSVSERGLRVRVRIW